MIKIDDNDYGTLIDSQILEYCKKGELIISEFEKNNIKQACYELRASNEYHDLHDDNKKYILEDDEYILIKPKQLVVVIVKETLKIPKNMLGRILTKGSLFSIGLIPVNTYADPGFEGKLGLVFNNSSNNYIKINVGENIAKIEFSKLKYDVCNDYKGQHGYSTGEWIVKKSNILTKEEIRKDPRINDKYSEIETSYGKLISDVIKRVFSYERKLVCGIAIYSILTMILIAYIASKINNQGIFISTLVSVICGIISSVLFSILTIIATNLNSKYKGK